MKNFVSPFLFCLFVSPFTLHAESSPREAQVLRAIDDICGDTWCEGNFNYHFDGLDVRSADKQVELFFRMILTEPLHFSVVSDFAGPAKVLKQSFHVSCTFKGVTRAEDLLSGEHSLRWDIYESLNECIRVLEGRLSQVAKP